MAWRSEDHLSWLSIVDWLLTILPVCWRVWRRCQTSKLHHKSFWGRTVSYLWINKQIYISLSLMISINHIFDWVIWVTVYNCQKYHFCVLGPNERKITLGFGDLKKKLNKSKLYSTWLWSKQDILCGFPGINFNFHIRWWRSPTNFTEYCNNTPWPILRGQYTMGFSQ